VYNTNRDWEDSYRQRWQFDKIVRSTHGVNCTGSCSWKIYVKNGLVTWETQQTDYPRTARPAQPRTARLPARAFPGISTRQPKYPLVPQLIELARGAGAAYRSGAGLGRHQERSAKAQSYRKARGKAGLSARTGKS
jgi:nitrate reductase alpha subunit